MVGVREFGRYFEEFVVDYLRVVEDVDLIEMEYYHTIKIDKRKAKERRSAEHYPGDIDIIGLKNNEIWMVECEEAITKRPSENDVERMKKKFKTIKKIVKERFPTKNIKKFIAYITNENNISKKDFQDDAFLFDVGFLSFKGMLKELIKKTKDQNGSVALGRYHWLFERLRRPDTKECLKNLLNCLETSK